MIRFYGKTEPMCLIHIMIGILPQNNHLHLAQRGKMKCIKNIFRRRIDHIRGILLFHKLEQLRIIWLPELIADFLQPVILYHSHSFISRLPRIRLALQPYRYAFLI